MRPLFSQEKQSAHRSIRVDLLARLPLAARAKSFLLFMAAACEARAELSLPSLNVQHLTSAHVDGRSPDPMIDQRPANAAAAAIKAMPTVTETAAANG